LATSSGSNTATVSINFLNKHYVMQLNITDCLTILWSANLLMIFWHMCWDG